MGLVPRRATYPHALLGGAAFAALLLALLLVPAAADAAKLRIGGGAVTVSSAGVAGISVTNPNRSAAKGKLTLVSAFNVIGQKSFRIPARKRRTVKVPLIASAFTALQQQGSLATQANTKVKRFGRSRKSLTLRSGGGTAPPPAAPGPGAQQPAPPSPGSHDGRWKGTWADNNANLSFNVRGSRLFTGPGDAFYIEATCQNNDPEYTGPQTTKDATAIEPIEATIGPDGRFSGQGVYRPSADMAKNWTVTGTLVNGQINDGEFSVSYTGYGGDTCNGTSRFTAYWYGPYEW